MLSLGTARIHPFESFAGAEKVAQPVSLLSGTTFRNKFSGIPRHAIRPKKFPAHPGCHWAYVAADGNSQTGELYPEAGSAVPKHQNRGGNSTGDGFKAKQRIKEIHQRHVALTKSFWLDIWDGDPEVRYMPNRGAVVNLTLATSETWRIDKQTGEMRENTEWHRVVMFGDSPRGG